MDDNSSSNDLPPSSHPSPLLFYVIHHQPSLKVMLTPHSAGVSRAQDVTEAFLLNYKKFISGQAGVCKCVTMSRKCMKCSRSLLSLKVDPHGECLSCREVTEQKQLHLEELHIT
ncbi:hypothetical protein E2C01_043449 [Portunus trituberculatus]|uniref:Uncharacterized protein n=1 Tax=Portunus trituberculatus TaxID=210409 RepID=A0A5B7FPJ0_PORTR|nr:hypothetical protein [Portunus trituberculatus]